MRHELSQTKAVHGEVLDLALKQAKNFRIHGIEDEGLNRHCDDISYAELEHRLNLLEKDVEPKRLMALFKDHIEALSSSITSRALESGRTSTGQTVTLAELDEKVEHSFDG